MSIETIFFVSLHPNTDQNMLLSIIIPAFNAARYLEACLDSCLALEADKEIIVVDDGSTDQTPSILERYAQQHPLIRTYHQANQGQSVARNLAISIALGDYIYMVDADDCLYSPTPDVPPVLPIATMQSQRYDIIGLQVMYQQQDGTRRPWSHQMQHWPFDREYATGADFVRCHNIEGLVYGYLFRRSLFVRYPELRFTPGIYHQDEELIFKIFTLAGPVVYRRGYTYLYYEREGSSINTRTLERRRRLMDHNLIIIERLIQWRDERQLHDVMHFKLAYFTMDVLRQLIRYNHPADYQRQVIERLRMMGLYPLPWLNDVKYLGMKLLTLSPSLIRFWTWVRQ